MFRSKFKRLLEQYSISSPRTFSLSQLVFLIVLVAKQRSGLKCSPVT